jgi:LysR family transcriptional activator of nhaA
MPRLNYHYLRCFWAVAREGGLAGASGTLHLSASTISTQIRALERDLGQKLFARVGRKLTLTDSGHMVLRYADDIFGLGHELMGAVSGRAAGRTQVLRVGISQVIPKLVALSILEPAYRMQQDVRLVCIEDKVESLVLGLSKHELDMVLTDAAVPPAQRRGLFQHDLGESTMSFFAVPPLAREYHRNFPRSLSGCPLLLPTSNTAVRHALDLWFAELSIVPRVIGEFEDAALLKVFGQRGLGVFPAPSVVAESVRRQFDVEIVGTAESVVERYFAVTPERTLKHPVVGELVRRRR